jgi:hypothetical protein
MNGMNIPVAPLSYCRPHLILSLLVSFLLLVKGFKKKDPGLNKPGSLKPKLSNRSANPVLLCVDARYSLSVIFERLLHEPIR